MARFFPFMEDAPFLMSAPGAAKSDRCSNAASGSARFWRSGTPVTSGGRPCKPPGSGAVPQARHCRLPLQSACPWLGDLIARRSKPLSGPTKDMMVHHRNWVRSSSSERRALIAGCVAARPDTAINISDNIPLRYFSGLIEISGDAIARLHARSPGRAFGKSALLTREFYQAMAGATHAVNQTDCRASAAPSASMASGSHPVRPGRGQWRW